MTNDQLPSLPNGPAAIVVPDQSGDGTGVEAFDQGLVEQLACGTVAEASSLVEDEQAGESRHDLFNVMSDEDQTGSGRSSRQLVDGGQKQFARCRVEPRAGLVQNHQHGLSQTGRGPTTSSVVRPAKGLRRVVRQGARFPCVAAARWRLETLFRGALGDQASQSQAGVASRHHGIASRFITGHLTGQRAGHPADTAPQLAEVGQHVPVTQHFSTGIGPQVSAGDAQQSRLALRRFDRAAPNVVQAGSAN